PQIMIAGSRRPCVNIAAMSPGALLVTTLFSTAIPAFGQQLHLIAGSPSPNSDKSYATVLASVENGSVKIVRELVSGEIGTAWTAISYDHRKAVITTKPPDNQVILFDFDTAAVTKSCDDQDGTLKAMQWLLDIPERGLIFASDGADH